MSERRPGHAVVGRAVRLAANVRQLLAVPPATVGITLALSATTVLLLAGGLDTASATAARALFATVGGSGLLVTATAAGSRRVLTAGALLAVLGVALAGSVGGVPTLGLLLATATVFLALDAGRYGVTVAAQLGPGARSRRLLFAHTAVSTAVAGSGLLVGYLGFLTFDGHGSFTAFVSLLVGVLVLGVSLFWAVDG